jgi:mono/diheme cytochrome c family protein
MKGLYKRAKMFDDRPVTDANVRDLILKGGGKMVGFEDTLEPKQVDALIAYLKTL